VTWCDADIIEALNERGIHPTAETIRAVREHYYVAHIDDRMTEVGWAVIADTIGDLDWYLVVRLTSKARETEIHRHFTPSASLSR